MDVANCLKSTGNNLVVFFDDCDSLQLEQDLWLRGDNGLIFMISNTLWTIASRYKLDWDGELAAKNEQHLLKALSPEDSDCFLGHAGIENENLRKELVDLTEGYPIFLDLCIDFYVEYKKRHETEPTIADFDDKREEVIGKIFRHLNAAHDDAAKDMLEFLCVMNVWTDEIAIDTGRQVLRNFNPNTYERVKKFFSFIQTEYIKNNDRDFKIYRFDKMIQGILLETCDEKLIFDIKSAANEYFKSFFANKKIFDAKSIFLSEFMEKICR